MAEEMKETAITTADAHATAMQMFDNAPSFELAQRMAKMFTTSTIVPQQYQGAQNLGNCMVALEVAMRTRQSPFVVMQNLNVIHGRPTWGAQYLIALINSSGVFATPLRFEWSGEEGKDEWGCRAWVVDKEGNRLQGSKVTIGMARGEEWTKNSKWQTMPELMLQYRAAAFFSRIHCPELALGIATKEEAEDMAVQPQAPAVEDVKVEEIPVAEITPADAPSAAKSAEPSKPDSIFDDDF